jgi:two-component system, chemotaxis family, protein-glutamate methylesterase/glutaminase
VPSRDIVVVGGSLGAIDALRCICRDLPAALPAAVFVVVHVGQFGVDLAGGLAGQALLPVATAQDGTPIEPGKIFVAPADRHLLLVDGTIQLGLGPRENMARPAVDPLFRSAAVSYGPRVIGVVLSGLLNDGAAGLAAVKQCGGLAVVQNPADARADSMPLRALQSCDVDYRAPVAGLGGLLARLAREPAGPPVPIPREIRLEVDIALGRPIDAPTLAGIADPSPLSCPQCGGVLSEIRSKPPLRFRCQVGHGFTADVLDRQQEGSIDEALRVALRIIEERASLADRIAADARANGHTKTAPIFEERSRELRGYAQTIREAVLRCQSNRDDLGRR